MLLVKKIITSFFLANKGILLTNKIKGIH